MWDVESLQKRIVDMEDMLAVSERKVDIVTNLLKEASAEFERSLDKITVSEANFRAIFESAPEAIIILDIATRRILDCNPFTLEWLGYAREELLARRYDDLVEPGAADIDANIQRILHQGMVKIQDRRFLKKDGTVVDAEVTGTTIEHQGEARLLILVRDVTEREKAQDALRKSEQRFRDIATYLPDWIWEVNEDWVYTYSSRGAEKILGYRPHEIIGQPIWDRMPREDREALQCVLDKARQRPFAFKLYESRRLHRDGSVIHLESSGVPLFDEAGRLAGYRGIHRDVTERKRLEEYSRYKELFEGVSDPVFILGSRGEFLEVNDVVVDRFGYSREELLGMRVKDLVRPDQREILLETGRRGQMGESIQFELEMLSRTGEAIPFEFHARPVTYKGGMAILSVGRDLSMRKKLEQTLVMSERLTAVGEMASGVAHNFNNLLQMVLSAADAAAAKLPSGKMRETLEAIHRIQDASQRAAEVVRRIKDFTQFRDDDAEDTNTGFDLGDLAQEALELTKPLWKDLPDSRRYDVTLTRAEKCFARGKPSEIYEVIVNLIKNGLEAMPRGGTLKVSTEAEDDRIFLMVSDTGYGIPEEDLQRVFEPFFTSKGLKSSGLGLSSSYGIVKRHQGEIHVESEVGRGATFTVTLPRAQEPAAEEAAATALSAKKKIKFLMVDDEINILKAMEMFFEDTDVDIVTCRTAMDGFNAFRNGRFDVVLCDLGMDDMNGWDLGRQIKEYCRDKGIPKTPFLLYTGWDKRFDPAMLEEGGVDRVVVKPVPCGRLLQVLQEVVNGEDNPEGPSDSCNDWKTAT